MKFDNPCRVETLPASYWDWELQDALLHSKGVGIELPSPEVRFWTFENGLGVAARLSRDMLLAGLIYYDVWAFPTFGRPKQLTEKELEQRNLPMSLAPKENLLPEEVEEFLNVVESILC
jgi:hypothetical protein